MPLTFVTSCLGSVFTRWSSIPGWMPGLRPTTVISTSPAMSGSKPKRQAAERWLTTASSPQASGRGAGAGHRCRWRRAEEVHVLVHPLHRARLQAMRDRAPSKPGGAQLVACDHVVLAAGDPGDRVLDGMHHASFGPLRGGRAVWRMPHMRHTARPAPSVAIVVFCRSFRAHEAQYRASGPGAPDRGPDWNRVVARRDEVGTNRPPAARPIVLF